MYYQSLLQSHYNIIQNFKFYIYSSELIIKHMILNVSKSSHKEHNFTALIMESIIIMAVRWVGKTKANMKHNTWLSTTMIIGILYSSKLAVTSKFGGF